MAVLFLIRYASWHLSLSFQNYIITLSSNIILCVCVWATNIIGYCFVLCGLSRAHLSCFCARQCFRHSIPRSCLPEQFLHQISRFTLCAHMRSTQGEACPPPLLECSLPANVKGITKAPFVFDGLGSMNDCAFPDPISIRIFAVIVCSTAMVNASLSCPIQFSDHFTIHSHFLWPLPSLFIQACHSKLSFLS